MTDARSGPRGSESHANQPSSAPAARALVFSQDYVALRLLIDSLKPFAIHVRICAAAGVAVALLEKEKFEAVIVDVSLGEDAALVMRHLRLSRTNKTAVSFVITSAEGAVRGSTRPDSTFVLDRPLSAESIGAVVRAAYGMVVRERRRYFRCPVHVTAFVHVQPAGDLLCSTVNISEAGMAVSAPTVPALEFVSVRFTLPGLGSQFFAETKVCWRGEDGQVGLEFVSLPCKLELQEWLSHKLDDSLPESVSQLFRTVQR